MSTDRHARIPQTSPLETYVERRDALDATLRAVLAKGIYILGDEVKAFEQEFAAFLGAQYAIGVGNGTDAIELALRACGVEDGDRVVTVSHTAVATVAAIRRCGGIPVLVDIDPATYTMDPESLSLCLRRLDSAGKKVKVIVPVHLYGCPADMPSILSVAGRYDIPVVEDCAQAHGATQGGRRVGTMGALGAFSFYPTKNLGAFGDGGAVLTQSGELASKIKSLRQYGWRQRYISETDGINSRLDEMQAAMLRVLLPELDEGNKARRSIAEMYTRQLRGTGLALPVEPVDCRHVYHQYVIRVPRRDTFRSLMAGQGVDTAIHYPLAVHQQAPYRECAGTVSLENTERILPEIVSLPIYPQLGFIRATRVCEVLAETLSTLL